jgi:uncharacterized membrane protein YgcG
MNDSDFTPQEQELINRLENAPQSDLSPEPFNAIRTRILDGMDSLPIENNPPRLGRSTPMSAPVMAAIAAVLVVVIGVSVLLLNQPQIIVTPTTVPVTLPSATIIVPSATFIAPTAIPTVEITVTESTSVPAQITTPEVTPEISLTPTLESVIIVEGPVQTITANVITIYGIDIALNPDDPLLTVIVVGDVLRVEANYDTTATVIVAVTVEPVSNEVNVNPDTDETWRDDGSCNNPPPPWAPANGWRRRCENATNNNSGGNSGNGNGNGNNGNGNGNGNNDKDDDD